MMCPPARLRPLLPHAHGDAAARVRCVECGERGGAFVVFLCSHHGEFAVCSRAACARRYRRFELRACEHFAVLEWARDAAASGYSPVRVGCYHCRIWQVIDPEPEPAPVPEVCPMNDPKVHPFSSPATSASSPGFWQKIGEQARTEAGMACLRAAARQFMKTAQVPLLGALRSRKVDVRTLDAFLRTPIGEGLFGFGLGVVLPHLPGVKGRVLETMGTELRVQGLGVLVSEVSDVLLEPLRDALAAAFVAELPESSS